MSVTKYQREFTRLSKYAPEILVSEEEKCRRFEDGLNNHIRSHATGFFQNRDMHIECGKSKEREKREKR